jgi:hypothetical protein
MKDSSINQVFVIMTSAIILSISGCIAVAPINSTFEGARTLKEGQVELGGNISTYSISEDKESTTVNQNFGFRTGIGITDRFTIRGRYERLMLSYPDEETGIDAVNYFDIGIKYAFAPEVFSGALTLSRYWANGESFEFIGPKLIVSAPINNKIEPTFALKGDFCLKKDSEINLIGINIGVGFSSDLDKWAIRPEFGFMKQFNNTGSYMTWGVGFNYNIDTR